jgi:hypothetical protein
VFVLKFSTKVQGKTIQAAVKSTVWKIQIQLRYKIKNSPVILGLGEAQKFGVSEISHPAE